MKIRSLKAEIKDRSGKTVQALIDQAQICDLEYASHSGKFKSAGCDWVELKDRVEGVFKLTVNGEVLGLMYLWQNGLDMFEIKYLETSIDLWERKDYSGAGGCLIAYACLLTKENGGDELYVMPNSAMKAKNHYENKYGMQFYDDYFNISTKENCDKIIKDYIG